MNVKRILALASALTWALGSGVNAHTVSYGFENAGPGAVTIWMGSYHSLAEAAGDGQPNEGFLQIQGINGNPFPLTALDFNLATGTEPVGLEYAYEAPGWVNGSSLWQGATFSAVAVGDYSFFFNPSASLNGNPATSVVFAPLNTSVQTGTFNLSAAVVQPPSNGNVPDGGSTAALFGLAISAMIGARKKFLK